MSLTWSDIADFVAGMDPKASVQRRVVYKAIGRQALGMISREALPIEGSWSNTSPGTLTLTGNAVTLPTDCLTIDRVEWNGAKLHRTTVTELDRECSGWRTATGPTPYRYAKQGAMLYLDLAPTGTTTGLLVIRGAQSLPVFSDNTNDPNPMDYIPEPYQYAPAYFIIGMLPVDPKDAAAVAMKQQYMAMWQAELPQIVWGIRNRKFQQFGY